MRTPFLLLLVVLLAAESSSAQEALQSPSEFLGYELGSRFTRHHQVIDYVRHVTEASPNVTTLEYGATNEGRPLVVSFVSTPANIGRLEEIRTDNLKLAGLMEGEPTGALVTIVWLSYNVHGNESVSTEAAMATLFDLADASNEQTQRWLDNTVVVIDPVVNPDGRDRYVNWYNQALGTYQNAAPEAMEHAEPAPGGRANHYNFDLNRDWAWLTQQETGARIALYNRWMPHVHVDFHEQGVNSPYYFAPGAEPLHEVITKWQQEFQEIIGRNHARYFDQNGWLYFTEQVFDLFYPGYGDTFPMYNGAIGMTYEQAGGGRAGLGILTAEGDTLSLADRIAHHHMTSLSTIEMGSVHHDRVLKEFGDYFSRANTTPGGPYKTFVVKAKENDARLQALAEHLQKLGIRSGTVTSVRRASGFSYRNRTDESFETAPGDLVISMYQPRSTLLNVLFEPVSAISDSITYDITAWALPYAYDVEAYATATRIDPDQPVAETTGGLTASVEQPYAWLIHWSDVSDVRFLGNLLEKDIKVRYAEKAFEIAGEAYEPGTLIVTRTGNEKFGERLGSIVEAVAIESGQAVTAVKTGLVDRGSDFGSSDVRYIKRPNVAVLRGDGVSSYSSGELWHYFDRQIEYPVTMMTPSSFARVDLNDYTVLVLPEGSYREILPESGLDRLKGWIRSGGRLIAIGDAASFFIGKDGFTLNAKKAEKKPEKKEGDDAGTRDESEAADTLKIYEERDRDRVTETNSGSIYRVTVDKSHPLAFGFDSESFILKQGSQFPAYMSGSGVWNVGVLKEKALVSGQVGYEAKKKIEESLAFGVQNMGSGSIVYLMDNPLFRGFWYSGQMLVGNAVFLVGQ